MKCSDGKAWNITLAKKPSVDVPRMLTILVATPLLRWYICLMAVTVRGGDTTPSGKFSSMIQKKEDEDEDEGN